MRKEKGLRERGITLELAMILIAFVLLAALVAFAHRVAGWKPELFFPLPGEEKGPTTLEAIDRSLGGGWLIQLQNGHTYQVGGAHCDVVGKSLRCEFPLIIEE